MISAAESSASGEYRADFPPGASRTTLPIGFSPGQSSRAVASLTTATCAPNAQLGVGERPAWRECPYYTKRERAALEWTEAVTQIASGHAAEETYEAVRRHFTEKELSDLTLAVAAINAWNRLSIAARLVPGKLPGRQTDELDDAT